MLCMCVYYKLLFWQLLVMLCGNGTAVLMASLPGKTGTLTGTMDTRQHALGTSLMRSRIKSQIERMKKKKKGLLFTSKPLKMAEREEVQYNK